MQDWRTTFSAVNACENRQGYRFFLSSKHDSMSHQWTRTNWFQIAAQEHYLGRRKFCSLQLWAVRRQWATVACPVLWAFEHTGHVQKHLRLIIICWLTMLLGSGLQQLWSRVMLISTAQNCDIGKVCTAEHQSSPGAAKLSRISVHYLRSLARL